MSSSHRLSEEEIFRCAVMIESTDERKAYLKQVCQGDNSLYDRVMSLLNVQADCDGFLENQDDLWGERPNAVELLQNLRTREEPPLEEVGPYRIVRKIGEGGMGVVYLVNQNHPIKRSAALKLLRYDKTNPGTVARFKDEQKTLARMDHPNIAKVLDAGTAKNGQPYFVMDLVRGIPITQYCDDRQLTISERLELFVQVCQGCQHAHYKGIIHRDLKPSNILVADCDHEAVPKIIDFGIAKKTWDDLNDEKTETDVTALSMFGTLAYMSPEQVMLASDDLDTRSDIYSLGVVLYELLCGKRPFSKELEKSKSLQEVLEVICEQEPRKPSQMVSTGNDCLERAAARGESIALLSGRIRRDLDWITLKVLSKDPADRYQTTSDLCKDIQLHLADRPILARRPSLRVKVNRFCRRNRSIVAVGGVATCFLLGFLYMGVLTRSALESRDQVSAAQAALDDLRVRADRQEVARRVVQPQIRSLRQKRLPVRAFREARRVQGLLGTDMGFQEQWASLTTTVSCTRLPQGTTVWARDALARDDEWEFLGVAPFVNLEVPIGDVRLRFEHESYVPKETQMKFPVGLRNFSTRDWQSLSESVPGMVRITRSITSGGDAHPIRNDFLIDQYEVTNSQYQEFVDAGGYEKAEYWSDISYDLVGVEITWKSACQQFVDTTGVHGPATWKHGRFPTGKESYPVEGVSWYEANAYAKFRGKSLPTFAHWRRASFCDQPGIAAKLSNYGGNGTAEVGQYKGIGCFDAYDMYGNVREWCWNGDAEGNHALLGGSYSDPDYNFYTPRIASPWQRDEGDGFRCAIYLEKLERDDLSRLLVPKVAKVLDRVERMPFSDLKEWYNYDREQPLNVVIHDTESSDGANDKYRHEIVEVDGPFGEERLPLHLLVPRDLKTPGEVVIGVPGIGCWNSGGAFQMGRKLLFNYSHEFASAGRIVCFPVYRGTFERWSNEMLARAFRNSPISARNDWIYVAQEISRTVDYLLTRDDVHPHKISLFGLSAGALRSVAVLAVDQRVATGILLGGGYSKWHEKRPEIHEYQFAPHVKQPVLMINGLHDEIFSHATSQLPLFKDLGSKVKQHEVFPAYHLPEKESVVKLFDEWLDDIFGSSKN